jgi:hypothetical protein
MNSLRQNSHHRHNSALPVGASVFPRGMKSVSIPLKWTADFRLVNEKFQGGCDLVSRLGRQPSVDSRKLVLILAAASPSNASALHNTRFCHDGTTSTPRTFCANHGAHTTSPDARVSLTDCCLGVVPVWVIE